MWFGLPERNTLRPWRECCCIVVCCSSPEFNLNGLALKELVWSELVSSKCCLPGPFIAQGQAVTLRPKAQTGGPKVVETLYNI
jgi:hypothetical protein